MLELAFMFWSSSSVLTFMTLLSSFTALKEEALFRGKMKHRL